MSKKDKLIVITGPTAVGKTALSIQLAQQYHGEIINGDAMQIYQHLKIGTAQPSEEEYAQVPHHLFGYVSVEQSYSVSEYVRDAREKITEVIDRGCLPVVVGGTGLYLESLIYDFSLGGAVEENPAFRADMARLADQKGVDFLHQRLEAIDPIAASQIHPNNVRRVIRALEVCTFSDQLFSSQKNDEKEPRYDTFIIALTTDRSLLYERINQRVDEMMKKGLKKEAIWLYQQNLPEKAQCLQAIAYKELFPYLVGEMSEDEAFRILKKNSRHYAKRQLTWIRHKFPHANVLDLIQEPNSYLKMRDQIDDFLIERD